MGIRYSYRDAQAIELDLFSPGFYSRNRGWPAHPRTLRERDMEAKTDDKSAGKRPFTSGAHTHRDWWPTQLSIEMLHRNSALSDPMDKTFDYAKEFKSLDLNAVI